MCLCHQPAIYRTVVKEGPNTGKEFWCCSQKKNSGGCSFFKWKTTPVLPPVVSALLMKQEVAASDQTFTDHEAPEVSDQKEKKKPRIFKIETESHIITIEEK